jgi:glucose/arabinose dehydrogenase
MVFLPDNRILITERAGSIRIVQDGKLLDEKVQGVPAVHSQGQGGLMDIKLHPDYDENGWIYFTYSKPGQGGAATAFARAKLQGNSFTDLVDLFVAEPYVDSNVHFGSRIAFDGNGHVFVSTGERGTKPNAQDLSNHYGKILRFNEDGSVPNDNPFVNDSNAKPEIWTYGHRNVQGMVYDLQNNLLWAHEHGPKGGDEINLIKKGNNHGWPLVTFGVDYDGTVISDKREMEGVEKPVHYWDPSIAPCGMAIVTSDRFPNWKGNLLVGALAHQHVARVEINNRKYVAEEKLLDQVGRVRAVSESPDGYIYVATEGTGLFLKLIPANTP